MAESWHQRCLSSSRSPFVVSIMATASGGVVAESLRLLSNHTDVFAAPLTLTSPGNATRTFTSLSQVSRRPSPSGLVLASHWMEDVSSCLCP